MVPLTSRIVRSMNAESGWTFVVGDRVEGGVSKRSMMRTASRSTACFARAARGIHPKASEQRLLASTMGEAFMTAGDSRREWPGEPRQRSRLSAPP